MEKLKIVYRGAATDTAIYSAFMDGTYGWRGNTTIRDEAGHIDPKSLLSPSIAVFHNWLYMVFLANNSPDLWFAWHDGANWSGDVRISDMNGGISPKSDRCPNLVVFQNKLYMTYKAWDSSVLYVAWFDGTTWYGNTPIGQQPGGLFLQSDRTPAMCVYNKRLYLVYKVWNDLTLNSVWFDGATWHDDKPLRDQPGHINPPTFDPSLAVFQNQMHLIYLSVDKNNQLYSASFDGTAWQGDTPLCDQQDIPDAAPAITVYNNRLYVLFVNDYYDDRQVEVQTFFSTSFDGSDWDEPLALEQQPGSMIAPRTEFGPSMCVVPEQSEDKSDWMKNLDDSMLLSDLNLPGTHDSAAFNSTYHTLYACQHLTITKQLRAGIRVLDVRLKIKKAAGRPLEFVTCHGSIGSSTGANEYQSFVSLMDECRLFLSSHPLEAIVMSLKVDDWANTVSTADQNTARVELRAMLNGYPVMRVRDMPNLDSARGKIFLLNRINDELSFGTPVSWPDNTSGSLELPSANRSFAVYVQDKYSGLSTIGAEKEKCDLVENAFKQYRGGRLLLNFASATWYGVYGVYIMGRLLDSFGKNRLRPVYFGWIMLDYPTDKYDTDRYSHISIVDIIIDSNVHYRKYADQFRVIAEL